MRKEKELLEGVTGISASRRDACIKEIEASLRRLDEQPPAVAARSPAEVFNEVREAKERAEAKIEMLISKGRAIEEHAKALAVDLEAVARAISIADVEIKQAQVAYQEAHSLLGPPGTQRHAAAEAPTEAAALCAFISFFTESSQKYAAYKNGLPEGVTPIEEDIYQARELRAMKVRWEAEAIRLSPQAAPPPACAQQPPLGAQAPLPVPPPTASSAAPRAVPLGDGPDGARLTRRLDPKAATLEASNPSSIIEAADKAARIRRKEARSDLLEARRETEEPDGTAEGGFGQPDGHRQSDV